MADNVAVIATLFPQILSSFLALNSFSLFHHVYVICDQLTNEWKPELVLDERHVERCPEDHEGDGVGILQLGVVHDGRDHQEDGEHQHYDGDHDRDLQ